MRARAVALVVLAVAGALALAGPSRAADPVVATQDCQRGTQRPTTIVLFCGDAGASLTGLRWSQWGGVTARGRGTLSVKSCDPNCAEGGVERDRVSVDLRRRRRCPGVKHRFYRSAAVRFADGRTRRYAVPCPV